MASEPKLSAKQKEYIHNATHRWNVKTGATASGKTFLDYAFVIPQRILKCTGEGLIVLIGNNINSIERNVLSPMREIWPGLVSPIRQGNNTAQIFGRRCFVMGADKVNQVARIQGTTIEYAYGDEVTTWNREFFEMLKSRLRAPNSCFDGTCNPEHPKHWFKEFLDGDADIYQQAYRLDDNPYLPQGTAENIKQEYYGTVYYDRYVLGKWKPAEGLIYRRFADSPEQYIIDDVAKYLKETRQHVIAVSTGVDFGGNKSATAFVAALITSKKHIIFVLDEKITDVLDPNKLNAAYLVFAKSVEKMYGRGQTRADSAESILIRGLFNAANANNLPEVKNAIKMHVNDRIHLGLLLMAQGRFKILRTCKHVIDAFSSAVYDSKSYDDKRLDNGTSDIDTLDASEYAMEPFYKELTKG